MIELANGSVFEFEFVPVSRTTGREKEEEEEEEEEVVVVEGKGIILSVVEKI